MKRALGRAAGYGVGTVVLVAGSLLASYGPFWILYEGESGLHNHPSRKVGLVFLLIGPALVGVAAVAFRLGRRSSIRYRGAHRRVARL